jgi:hypothetical protein
MTIPVSYKDDRTEVDRILLEVARRHSVRFRELSAEALKELQRRYAMASEGLEPRVYWRITDNWLELTSGSSSGNSVRDVKDVMSREILEKFDSARIGIASATFEVVGVPPLQIESRTAAS